MFKVYDKNDTLVAATTAGMAALNVERVIRR